MPSWTHRRQTSTVPEWHWIAQFGLKSSLRILVNASVSSASRAFRRESPFINHEVTPNQNRAPIAAFRLKPEATRIK